MIKGPYLLDPDAGLSVTNTDTTTVSALGIHQHYGSVDTADATSFPDAPGYIVFGYGYGYEVGPVKYLGRISNTALALDYGFEFPVSIPVGAVVTLLKTKGPYNPADPETIGCCYLTASPAGRVAAAAAVDEMVAVGRDVEKTITYPGDRGLGNEGQPVAGINKISDAVAVWAGNELDDEVDTARAS